MNRKKRRTNKAKRMVQIPEFKMKVVLPKHKRDLKYKHKLYKEEFEND